MTGWTEERVGWLRERAVAAGFTLAGVAAATSETVREQVDGERFETWVEAGFAGEMNYLKRRDEDGRLLRSAVSVAIPWARSVVLCAINYRMEGPLSTDAAKSGAGWIGRYAWSGRQKTVRSASAQSGAASAQGRSGSAQGRAPDGSVRLPGQTDVPEARGEMTATDYHEVLLGRLRVLEGEIRAAMPCESRCYVDTGPVVERAVATRAGVGWIGKNTTIINQGLGSWTLLASIITSIPVEPSGVAVEAADRCGTCTRCLEACPTDALIAPHQMDARRCIAYLTIEKKGPIDEELREGMGRQVFGCDICQDVCPWNRRAPVVTDAEMLPRAEMINPDLDWLAGMTSAEFRRWFKGSPLERTGKKRLHRNVAIAMGNSREDRFRTRLEMWARGEDAVLAEAATWALRRLQRPSGIEIPMSEG
jgi:epoxyqueuosine reductase